MLETVRTIFGYYISGISRYNIYSIETYRGENPEDLYYLCHIGDSYYIVLETDYIDSLSQMIETMIIKFPELSKHSLHWLVKKDCQPDLKASVLPLDSPDTKQLQTALILRQPNSYLRYVVLAITAEPNKKAPRYNPTTYGNQ